LLAPLLANPATGGVTVADLAGRRVLFLGDSITEHGSYLGILQYYLERNQPTLSFDFIGAGLGSETASGLSEPEHPFPRPCVHERLARALDKARPELVFACYGMNDGIYHPPDPGRERAFRDGIERLVRECRAAGVRQVLLLTPTVFDARAFGGKASREGGRWSFARPHADYDQVLEAYARWIMKPRDLNVTAIDLRGPMLAYQQQRTARDAGFRLAPDGIHPASLGHWLMARAILAALGATLPAGEPEAELRRLQADPLFVLVERRRKLRSAAWLPFIGYTRGETCRSESVEVAEREVAALGEQINSLRRARHTTLAATCLEVLVDGHLNGSGWLAPRPRHAFTAAHVVAGKPGQLAVRLHDGRVLPARVRARDLLHDAALLELEVAAGPLPVGLPFAAETPAAGQPLWLFGAPQYRHDVMLPGTVANAAPTYEWLSNLSRAVECRLVACTAPKGMSGGPWVDASNQVVGLQSGGMTYRDTFCGISFVTPASALARLLETGTDQPAAWFGAAVEELDEQPAAEIRRFPREAAGLVLKSLAKSGPAATADLSAGTLLTRCAGQQLVTRHSFYQLLATLRPGDQLELTTLAPGQPEPRPVTVKLGE
jgi:S1-C subfamily serine protease/lysophospholipase L1-like esterase